MSTPDAAPGTLQLARLRGVPLLVRPSWLIAVVLLTMVVAERIRGAAALSDSTRYLAALVFVTLFYLTLLGHELAHALVGVRAGRKVRSVTLHFYGGATTFDAPAESPRADFWVSFVGPFATLVFAGLAYAVAQVTSGVAQLGMSWLAYLNLFLGIFNLLPGLPLDGGHMVAAATWRITGDRERGLRVAATCGKVVAVLVVLSPQLWRLGGVSPSLTDFLISAIMGAYLWSGAAQAAAYARLRARLPAISARALARRALAVPADLSVAEAVRRAQEAGAGAVVVHLADDRVDGIVSERALSAVPAERRPWMPVSSVARQLDDGLVLPADLAGQDLLNAMVATPATEYLLVEPDGRLFGVLAQSDVEAAFARAS